MKTILAVEDNPSDVELTHRASARNARKRVHFSQLLLLNQPGVH